MTQPINREDVLRLLDGAIETPPPVGAVSARGRGGALILEDIERLFQFFERAEPLFEKFSARLMQIREFEGNHGQGPEDQDGEAMYLEAPEQEPRRAPAAARAFQTQAGPAEPTSEAPISSIKVYQFLCGMLAQLPKEQTIGDAVAGVLPLETTVEAALAMVRDYKTVIMAVLDEKLKETG